MITALVQFNLPEPVTPEKAKTLFVGSAPDYLGLDATGLGLRLPTSTVR